MRRSTFYTRWTRTWRWARSRCSWKARTRRPPAPGRPTRCTTAPGLPPRTPSSTRRSPGSPLGAPPSRRRRTRPAAGLTQTCPPPPLQDQGCPPQGAGPLAGVPWHPPVPPRRRDPRGPGADPGDHPHPPLWGNTRTPPPPPGARGAGRSTHLPANTGGHRRYGGPPGAAAPDTARRPQGAQGPGPRPRLGAVARRVGRVAPLPPLPMPVDGRRPPAVRG